MKVVLLLLLLNHAWCCELGYTNYHGNCYFDKDINFLKALIQNSQNGKKSPRHDLNPINLGWQHWEEGRLVEFCCSTSTLNVVGVCTT